MSRLTPQKPRILRRMTFKALLIAAVSVGIGHSGIAQNQYWDQYSQLPVLMQQNNNGAQQTLKFVDFKDGMLVAELEGGVGEVSLPVTESMANSLRLAVDTKRARDLIDTGNYVGALQLLRPEVYPLIKFHQVPDNLSQLHGPVRLLIDTLVDAGEYTEAEEIVKKLELGRVGVKYSESAIRLMNGFIFAKDFNSAARIAGSLPVEGDYASNIAAVVEAADALRGAGQYEAVIPLYQAIESAVTDEVRANVQMWLAYSLVLADRVDEAQPILDGLEVPDPKDRLFSLYKLLEGSKAHREKNYADALDVLTRGFVRAQTSYAWVPEMLFLIGDCYSKYDDTVAARNVWTEIVILYPQSPWAKRAQTSLDLLPKPEISNN
jgi:thioredoxin-like negative regulator of GroEL